MENQLPLWYTMAKDALMTFGFPIFVAVYLLVVQNRTLQNLREAIEAQTEATRKMSDLIVRQLEGPWAK